MENAQKKKCDGHTRVIQAGDLLKGVVVRMISREEHDALPPFSDCVVLGFDGDDVVLGRPMVYAGQDTAEPYMYCEKFKVLRDRMYGTNSAFRLVTQALGTPFEYTL